MLFKFRNIIKSLSLIIIGGTIYNIIEILFRGYTHWTMFIVGGLCFFLIGAVNEVFSWETPLLLQCLIGALIVTLIEFVAGVIVNMLLGWNVWDYSNMPLNVLGQICLPFSVIWFFLSAVGIFCDDFLRLKLFNEEFKKYKII